MFPTVADVRKADACTAAEIASLHQPLRRFAELQLRNDGMAEDVLSETLLALLEKPHRVEGPSSLRPCLDIGWFAGERADPG